MADILGVARSNLVEQLGKPAPRKQHYRRQGDDELLAAIQQITDARPTCGYRRVTALLNRARRPARAAPVNHKRVFRLMRQMRLLLQPHVGHRPVRAHEGTVIAPASNLRWSSDVLEFGCWNGEIVRVAFTIDTHEPYDTGLELRVLTHRSIIRSDKGRIAVLAQSLVEGEAWKLVLSSGHRLRLTRAVRALDHSHFSIQFDSAPLGATYLCRGTE